MSSKLQDTKVLLGVTYGSDILEKLRGGVKLEDITFLTWRTSHTLLLVALSSMSPLMD